MERLFILQNLGNTGALLTPFPQNLIIPWGACIFPDPLGFNSFLSLLHSCLFQTSLLMPEAQTQIWKSDLSSWSLRTPHKAASFQVCQALQGTHRCAAGITPPSLQHLQACLAGWLSSPAHPPPHPHLPPILCCAVVPPVPTPFIQGYLLKLTCLPLFLCKK